MRERSEPRALIEAMFRAALEAVDPERVVEKALRGHETELLGSPRKLVVVAIGKAAERMAAGAVRVLGERIDAGFVITKDGHASGSLDDRFRVWEASHPVPDRRGVEATRALLAELSRLTRDDSVLALISGGGSALLEAPAPPLTLDDIAATTRLLLQAGAPIQDLNAVRIPLSLVKGGGLRSAAPVDRFVTLILSDVLGNDVRFIASGPTVQGQRSHQRALEILQAYGVLSKVPPAVPELLGKPDAVSFPEQTTDTVKIVGDNAAAIEAAARSAKEHGHRVDIVWRNQEGEARERGRDWVRLIVERIDADVLLGGGEMTVTVSGEGTGGRNTEFALAAAIELDRLENDDWAVASLATDGEDAMTGAAGGIVDRVTVMEARRLGLDPSAFLEANDSATLLERTGDLLRTGPTGTNVNDLYFAVHRRAVEGPTGH